jgi:L-ascorbate 6-phosphate lactonase
MIQPKQHGKTLLDDIDATQPAADEIAIWWLGQSGYAIKTASVLFYIDLYLSEHLTAKYAATEKPHIRMTASPLRGGEIAGAEWVLSSHKHSDHLDPGTMPDLFSSSPRARLILPLALVDHAVSLGLPRERLIPTRGDETITAGPMTIHSIPAAHAEFDYDDESGYPYLGYVIEVDGFQLYHSGDTIIYDGLADRLKQYRLDVAFLPINGTDERRLTLNVPPNMNMREAVELAGTIQPRLVIPHHYDMFTFNTADVDEFVEIAQRAGLDHAVLHCGQRFIWKRPRAE